MNLNGKIYTTTTTTDETNVIDEENQVENANSKSKRDTDDEALNRSKTLIDKFHQTNTHDNTITGNWLLGFKQTQHQELFEYFTLNDTPFNILLVALLLVTAFYLYGCYETKFLFNDDKSIVSLLIAIFSVCRIVAVIPVWLFICKRCATNFPTIVEMILNKYLPSSKRLCNIFIVIHALVTGCLLLLKCIAPKCEDKLFANFACNSTPGSIPWNTCVQTLFIYMSFVLVLPCRSWIVVLLTWFFYISIFIAATCIIEDKSSAVAGFLMLLVTFIFFHITEKNLFRMFVSLLNLETSIRKTLQSEEKEKTGQRRSVELNHLIGNIAHDLKTPMQGFSSGIENLSVILNRPHEKDEVHVIDLVEALEVLSFMRSTCSFMNMGINRSLDYRYLLDYILLSLLVFVLILHFTEIKTGKSPVGLHCRRWHKI